MFGASPRMPDSTIEQRALNIDGGAGTALYRFDGNLESLGFLRYDVTNLAYAIPNLKTGAVIGVGGGRDVLSQRLFGVSDVTGIEINPIIIDVLEHHFSDYTAIAVLDGVKFEVDEARSWFARTPRSFDVIQMSLIDTWAATGAGAFTLTENGLYTVEAWRRFLGRLNADGLFTVSRWYAPGEVNETGRLVSLAVATLLANGAAEPRRHLFLAAAGKVATLIVAKSPLSPSALAALKDAAKANEFTVLLSPDTAAPSAMLEKIVSATDRRALDQATAGFYLDLTPPTDARPFFFNQLGFARIFDPHVFSHFTHTGVFAGNLIATLTLAMLVVISIALVAATIIVPLRPTVKEAGWQLVVGGTGYFALIGVGFMMIEIALLQRMSVFLGHPVYALSVVLFSLILWTGFGSMASERMRLDGAGKLVAWSVASAAYSICVAVLAADRVRPRWSRPSCSRRPLCPCPGAGRLPDGLWISDRHAIGLHDQCRAHALVLGHQRRCRCSRCKHCRCHQYCLQHRYDAQDRSRLLPPGRRSRRVVGVRSCAIQPHGTTTPAPTRDRYCLNARAWQRSPRLKFGPATRWCGAFFHRVSCIYILTYMLRMNAMGSRFCARKRSA